MDEILDDDHEFIKKLHESPKEEMMIHIYNAIVASKRGALKHNDTSIAEKIIGVETVLTYFKDREEYKICAELKNIIDKLKEL